MKWATAQEVAERFVAETLTHGEAFDIEHYGFSFRTLTEGVMDDGVQFVSIERISVEGGRVFHGEPIEFCHYHAFEDAGSFVAAAFDCATLTFEQRLGAYGIEWEREQQERIGVAA